MIVYTPSQVIKLYVERYFKNTHKGFVDLLTLPLFQNTDSNEINFKFRIPVLV